MKPSKSTQKQADKKEFDSKKSNSILDLFKIDFSNMPDDTYVKGASIHSPSVESYTKKLNRKELSLFDIIEIIPLDDSKNLKSVIFHARGFRYISSDFSKLEHLINDLVKILGEDGVGAGEYHYNEKMEIESGEWNGRIWLDEKFEYPTLLSCNAKDGLWLLIRYEDK